MKRYLIPLIVFIVMLGFLAVGLQLNPREVPSPLINKPAPAFKLPTLAAPEKFISSQDLRGEVWVLNVWASWCVACRVEHPVFVEFAKTGTVPIYVSTTRTSAMTPSAGWPTMATRTSNRCQTPRAWWALTLACTACLKPLSLIKMA